VQDYSPPEQTDPSGSALDAATMILPRNAQDRAALFAELDAEDDEDDDSDSSMLDAATMMLSREEMIRRRQELLGEAGPSSTPDEPRREAFRPPGKKKP
jgi:hypothetical protein